MIDTHAHLFFDELLGTVGELGPNLERRRDGAATLVSGGFRYRIGPVSSLDRRPEERLEQLDAAGIDVQVVSASPLWYFSHTPAEVTSPFTRRYNDLLAEWAGADTSRLKALATLPVQQTGLAVAELERAVSQLGMRGAVIGTDARRELDDPELDDLYAACVDLDVPLFVHSVVNGVDGPSGDPRLHRWLGDVVLGYPFEETIAATAILLGGVLERHPRLDLCLSHGGGATPYLIGRIRAWISSGAAPIGLEEFDRNFQKLWFDVHVHAEGSASLLMKTANRDRLVLGTNFGGWDSASPAELDELALDVTANALRLLRL